MLNKQVSEEKLSELGEKEILNRLKEYMDEGQIDDDTALISSSKKDLIINTDILVENVHFNSQFIAARDIGRKAISVNLSDLACSGVEEIIGITIGLVLPATTPWNWVDNAYKGIKDALNEFGGKILGGDCSTGIEKMLSITAIGTQGPINLHRANAKPGDYLVASGDHGLSRLGLALLLEEPIAESIQLPNSLKQRAIKAHKKPNPPLAALASLRSCKPDNVPWRAAATDTSDGLLNGIECLCQSSKCTAILDKENLPIHKLWPQGRAWDEMCLIGGEDFELIVSLPLNWAQAWVKAMPSSKIIGKISDGSPKVIWSNGDLIETNSRNEFHHF